MDAEPEPEVLAAVHPVEADLVRVLELPRVVVRGAVEHHHGGARRQVDAADSRRDARQPELRVQWGLEPQRLLDVRGDAMTLVAELLLQVGPVRDVPEHGAQQAGRGFPAGGEEVGGDQHDVVGFRQRSVRERRGGELRHDVVARFAASILDVVREPLVEELERLVRHLTALRSRPIVALQLGAQRLVVGFRHAEQVGDDEEGERVRVLLHEVALAPRAELVDLAIGEPPHELLVLLESLRRDQPHQQPTVRGVVRRIERREADR